MPTAQVQEVEKTTGQKPVKVFRVRGVSASVFQNHAKTKDNRDVTFHKVSVQRSFKDGDDWGQNSSFGRDDLPLLKRVVDQAWDFILSTEAAGGKENAAE